MIAFRPKAAVATTYTTVQEIIDRVRTWDNLLDDGAELGILYTDNLIFWIDPVNERVRLQQTINNANHEPEVIDLKVSMTAQDVAELLDFEEAVYLYRKRIYCA